MASEVDLPDSLPLFPLPGALLLPQTQLPLHIFEPRYLAMVDDVLGTSARLIGMIQPQPSGDGLHRIGCAGRIIAFSEIPGGRYMITLNGVSRFRLGDEITGFSPYRRAHIDWSSFGADRTAETGDPGFDRALFLELLARYFDDKGLSTDWESLKDAEDDVLINALCMLCPFDPEEKQALLESPRLSTRRETLTTLIRFALSGGHSEDPMQ